jgi:hypothetical protein
MRRLAYHVAVGSDKRNAPASHGADMEAVRLMRLREDARRPISVNLAEGIALSHMLMRFTGAARKA